MWVLFTGSRLLDHDDAEIIAGGLLEVVGDDPGPHVLVHGDNRGDYRQGTAGGDQVAAAMAASWGWEVRAFPADWFGPCRESCRPGHRRTRPGQSRTTCPAAGPYRNEDMAALVAEHGGKGLAVYKRGAQNKGTSGCAQIARRHGIDMTRRTA